MRDKRAFTMVELVVALALLTVVLISFYPIIINNSKVNAASQRNLEAQVIAQNEIEEILFTSKGKTKVSIIEDLNLRQSELNQKYQDSSFEVVLEFFKEEHEKVLNLKVNFEGKLIYETETWLSYEE